MTRRAALLAAALLGCSADPPPAPVPMSASSSIAWSPDGRTLWITSPDDDRVLAVARDTLAVTRDVTVRGQPEALAVAGDRVLVALARRPALALVSPDGVTEVGIPCGGARAVVALSPDRALAACPHDDRLVVLDLARNRAVRAVASPGRPTALAVAGDNVYVSASRLGRLRTLSRAALASLTDAVDDDALDTPVAVPTLAEVALSTRAGFAASQVDAVAAVSLGGAPLAAWQRVDRDSDRARPPERGGYGAVFDEQPRIEPRVLAPCGGRYARFDGSASVTSGPSALAWAGGLLWVAHRYTDTVAVLACPASSSSSASGDGWARRVATFRTGRGPRGIALSPDGRQAWVDVGFDHAVALLDLDAPASSDPRDPARTSRRELGEGAPYARLLTGRNLFHDAVNTHLTPSGVVTCATCHPDGGDDGLTWFLHTTRVARKLRRTPPAWGAAPSLAPYHWDGEFTDAATLTRTALVELMGGDGLLVDTGAMAAWMASLRPAPPRPLTTSRRAQVERGRALFLSEAVGCARCHAGDDLTDRERHAVLGPSTDPDGALDAVDTPSLRGVRARAPHLHDGRAATLREVVTAHNVGDRHGRTSQLDARALDDLVAYLGSL